MTTIERELRGWWLAGGLFSLSDFQISRLTDEIPAGVIESICDIPRDFGTLMQDFSAIPYRGKRICFSANLRAERVSQRLGLWMRVDTTDNTVGFDDMEDRALSGTTEWTRCNVILDVPDNSELIALGLILYGTGKGFISEASIELVADKLAPTRAPLSVQKHTPIGYKPLNDEPTNFRFTN